MHYFKEYNEKKIHISGHLLIKQYRIHQNNCLNLLGIIFPHEAFIMYLHVCLPLFFLLKLRAVFKSLVNVRERKYSCQSIRKQKKEQKGERVKRKSKNTEKGGRERVRDSETYREREMYLKNNVDRVQNDLQQQEEHRMLPQTQL